MFLHSKARSNLKRQVKNHTNVRLVKTRIALLTDNKIHFTDGPLIGYDEAVKKYDRHKRSIMVRTEFLGMERDVWLAVDVKK